MCQPTIPALYGTGFFFLVLPTTPFARCQGGDTEYLLLIAALPIKHVPWYCALPRKLGKFEREAAFFLYPRVVMASEEERVMPFPFLASPRIRNVLPNNRKTDKVVPILRALPAFQGSAITIGYSTHSGTSRKRGQVVPSNFTRTIPATRTTQPWALQGGTPHQAKQKPDDVWLSRLRREE